MIRVLLVEDNEFKVGEIVEYLSTKSGFEVDVANSFTTAWKKMKTDVYDIYFLDMSIPTFDKKEGESGGAFRVFGGRDLAGKSVRKGLQGKILFITQYNNFSNKDSTYSLSEMRKDVTDMFPDCLGMVYFKSESGEWKEEVDKALEGVFSENSDS